MKLAIIGSRSLADYDIAPVVDALQPAEIVSGGAKGADSLAEQYARQKGIKATIIQPDYQKNGRAATFIRDRQIADAADMVLAFWDGKSHGTGYTIDYARKHGKTVKIVKI